MSLPFRNRQMSNRSISKRLYTAQRDALILKQKMESLLPNRNSQILTIELLRGITIKVLVKSKLITQILIKSLQNSGVKVADNADYILTDYKKEEIDSLKNSNKNIKIILVKQVPFLLENINFSDFKGRLVICDAFGRLRPNYKDISHMPQLILASIPYDQLISPFFTNKNQNSTETDFYMSVLEALPREGEQQLTNGGYCEICNKRFVNGREHQQSEEHKRNNTDLKWVMFDHLSLCFNRLPRKQIQTSLIISPII